MNKIDRLKFILKQQWGDNSGYVPTPSNYRCAELDWFSEGIRENILATIAIVVFGKTQSENLLNATFYDDNIINELLNRVEPTPHIEPNNDKGE